MSEERVLHARFGHSDKVSGLSHLGHRVWTTYLVAADDYGVVVDTIPAFVAANFAFERVRAADLRREIDAIVRVGLVHRFTHQQKTYLYQRDWQDHQRIRYPRISHLPVPPQDEIAQCSEKTRSLFALKGRYRDIPETPPQPPRGSRKVSETSPESSGNISETFPSRAYAQNTHPNSHPHSGSSERGSGGESRPNPDLLETLEWGWAEAQREASGIAGTRPGPLQATALAQLADRYGSADEVWKRARVMWRSPRYRAMTCNPKLLLQLAPAIDRHLQDHGEDAPFPAAPAVVTFTDARTAANVAAGRTWLETKLGKTPKGAAS